MYSCSIYRNALTLRHVLRFYTYIYTGMHFTSCITVLYMDLVLYKTELCATYSGSIQRNALYFMYSLPRATDSDWPDRDCLWWICDLASNFFRKFPVKTRNFAMATGVVRVPPPPPPPTHTHTFFTHTLSLSLSLSLSFSLSLSSQEGKWEENRCC